MNDATRKILVRAPNWVGDAVLVVPALRTLRQRFPQAEIAVLAKPWVADVYGGEESIDRVIAFHASGEHAGLGGLWRLVRQLAREEFDLAVLFQNAFQAALIARAAGIPRRVGYARDGRGPLLSDAIPVPRPGEAPQHEVFYYLELLRRLGWIDCLPPAEEIVLRVPGEAVERAEERLRQKGARDDRARIVMVPGAAYGPAKCWPAANYRALAARMAVELDADVIVCGSPAERPVAEEITAAAPGRILNLAGETTLVELMAIFSRAQLFVGNDSGAMHLAASQRLPQVVLFGPTDRLATGPINPRARILQVPVECSPCGLRLCPVDHRCMTRLRVADVFEHVRSVLAEESHRVA